MKRQSEPRPLGRPRCDLSDCGKWLNPHDSYPTLREGGHLFSGVRVFCCDDHRDEYETRLTLAKTQPRTRRERFEDHVPGVPYGKEARWTTSASTR